MKHSDPNNLPPAPTQHSPVSAAMFDVMLAAARKGGWPAVYTIFAEGEVTNEVRPNGAIQERPARRRTLDRFLSKRPDLRALLDSAAQERRDRLLSQLENEVESIALGPGDITQDFGKNGQLTRTRVDKRNKLHAILQLLKAHDGDTYGDRKRIDVAGRVDHTLSLGDSPMTYRLSADEILTLEPAEQEQLLILLDRIEHIRLERKNGNERELIDARPIESSGRLLEAPPTPGQSDAEGT